ncbi:MAG: MlaD family protein [bacterium]
MFKQLEGARLGIFIFIGTILLVLSIFMIGNKERLFVGTIFIKTYFSNVEGLRSGAPVRLSGMDVGSVSNIRLTDKADSLIEVTMRIDEEMIRFIRLDSQAAIETEGLVGKKLITITPSSSDVAIISDGSIIKAKNPVSMASIMDETQSSIHYVREITKEFSEIAAKINKGEGTIGKAVNDEQLYFAAVNITRSAENSLNAITARLNEVSGVIMDFGKDLPNVVSNVDSVVTGIKSLLYQVEQGKGLLGALIADRSAYDSIKIVIGNLAKTTESAVQGVQAFSENMEALKHNWLFKGYFEERGYWDKSEYDKELDKKLEEIKLQTEDLEMKIQQLRELESNSGNSESK